MQLVYPSPSIALQRQAVARGLDPCSGYSTIQVFPRSSRVWHGDKQAWGISPVAICAIAPPAKTIAMNVPFKMVNILLMGAMAAGVSCSRFVTAGRKERNGRQERTEEFGRRSDVW